MATKFEKVLDTIHDAATALVRVTTPRKKLDRDTIIMIFQVTTTIVGAAAMLIPQVKALAIAANLLTALGRTADVLTQNAASEEASTESAEGTAVLVPTPK
jgi:hypothetical protein